MTPRCHLVRWVGESDQPANELVEEQQDTSGEGSGDSQEQTPMPETDQSATAPLTDEPDSSDC